MTSQGEGRGEGDAGGAADWRVLVRWNSQEREWGRAEPLDRAICFGSIVKTKMLEQVELTEHRDETWG